jgi:hypothetical protein
MDFDNELSQEENEKGSDELLSDDNLRLPDNANPLVRLHAVRAWLNKRQKETRLDIGMIALDQQQLEQEGLEFGQTRRVSPASLSRKQAIQTRLQFYQQLLSTYEEAETLLEDCVDHTTISERLLVEYFLTIEELVQTAQQQPTNERSPRLTALNDVLHRVEQVGTSQEEE